MGFVKTKLLMQPVLSKTNILKCQNWTKNYIKIDLSKVIFTDETHDIGWAKGWILSHSNVPLVKRKR